MIYTCFVIPLFLEETNIRLLKLLPALCVPTMRIRKGMRNIKPTITESLNSFILSVNVSNIFISSILYVKQFYICGNVIAIVELKVMFISSYSRVLLILNIILNVKGIEQLR